jgi:hypothetical protein
VTAEEWKETAIIIEKLDWKEIWKERERKIEEGRIK